MKMTIKNKFGWGSLPIALFTALIMLVGCKEEYPAAGSIPDNTPPQANFSFAQLASDNYLEVTFTNLSTSSTDYLWDFGDGNTSTDFEPVHIYAAEGTYTVTLVSSDKLDVESLQPKKAHSPIWVTPSGIVTDVRPLQPTKAWFPIWVTLSGIVSDVSPLQPSNAQLPI